MKHEIPSGCSIEVVGEALGLKTKAAKHFLQFALENTILMDKKQQDYGSANISKFGVFGVLVRMSDKIERLKNLRYAGLSQVEKDRAKAGLRALEHLKQSEHKLNLFEMIDLLSANLEEIKLLIGNRRKQAVNESIEDTFRDTSNYAIIALLLEAKRWPDE